MKNVVSLMSLISGRVAAVLLHSLLLDLQLVCAYLLLFKKELLYKCYFLQKAHSAEQTPFKRVFQSTEAMWIKCHAQGRKFEVVLICGIKWM